MARIDVLTDRPIGTVDRRIFGSFTEHLGRCVYGGVFDEGSRLARPDGFRADVLAAVRDLGVTNVRWPGGNFVSGYHWTDGIGRDRPRRADLAWHGEESNRFGTDEFMACCAAAGVEPVFCLNMGTGTLDEALAWLEYCNGTGDTYWASRRRANGHAEPYGVRYWGLGNEMYGDWQIGQRDAAEYVADARRWAKALKRLDPGIRLVSCGQTGLDDWDRIVIDGLAPHIDFHSIHLYTGSADYWSNVLAPHYAERALSVAGALIDRARYVQRIDHEISVAYDEWNVWYRTDDELLDVAATRDPGHGRLAVSVVNRDPDRAIQTRLPLHDATATGVMTVHEVTGDSPEAVNTFARPDTVTVRNAKREVEGEHIDITFSPHSFTLLEVPLA